jgi:hypothetical protein
MYSFTDANVLTAGQLNSNFLEALSRTSVSAQSVASLVNLNGGATTTTLAVSGAATLSGAMVVNPTMVTGAGDYVVLATDRYLLIKKATGAATAVFLPGSPSVGRIISVKDAKGDAASGHAITITPNGADTIDGAANLIINTAYGKAAVIYIAGGWLSI